MTMMDALRRALASLLGISLGARLSHCYHVECVGSDGGVKWIEDCHNLVTTEGMNKYLDATLKTGLASPAWYVSLVKAKSGSYAAGDTLASHSGWTEGTPGTDWTGNRIAWTAGTVSAGSVDNSASKAVFPILQTLTIYGALLCSASTGTSGTLLGVADFGSSRSVVNGDTLNVTVTCSLS